MQVYLLWDGTDDWGSNRKVKLHSIHATKESAQQKKSEQWMDGNYFYIETWKVEE